MPGKATPQSAARSHANRRYNCVPPDGIDGKQARRLGMSGPLGELFDHGLDSWTSFFIPVTLFSVFGKVPCSFVMFATDFIKCKEQVQL